MPSRGEPPEADLAEINSKIPEAVSLEKRALDLNPDELAMLFGPRSDRDKAAAYLQDVADFLTEARYALFEARAHWIWHTKDSPREPSTAALFWARYYLDDAVLRMYSTGEHVAGFVKCYLGIGGKAIKDAKKEVEGRGKGQLGWLGEYCRAAEQRESVLCRIIVLLDDPSWTFVSQYRHKWVHAQRLRLQGLGHTYERRKRWAETKPGTFLLGIGQGDPPDLTIEKFFEQTIAAYALLRDLVGQCCDDLEAEVALRRSRTPSLSSKER